MSVYKQGNLFVDAWIDGVAQEMAKQSCRKDFRVKR